MAKKVFKKLRKAQSFEQYTGTGNGFGNENRGLGQQPMDDPETTDQGNATGFEEGSGDAKGQGQGDGEGNGEGKNQSKSQSPYVTDKNDLKEGSKFYGTIKTAVKKEGEEGTKMEEITDMWTVKEMKSDENITVVNKEGKQYKTSKKGIKMGDINAEIEKRKKAEEEKRKQQAREKESEERKKNLKHKLEEMDTEDRIGLLIDGGIRNLWMVGPAGCGKSTIARHVAKAKELPYLCISCGVGTSAAEFVGYKYPNREATKFAEYYAKPSIILIDEMTALEPAVAQVLNAALANDEIETTTGLVQRHKDCIIIATSNTFGNGADRQYVANNQLDSSTLDRFVGGIIEVNYSAAYESTYDIEVVEYVHDLRKVIAINELRRVASTRMVISGHNLKCLGIKDWQEALIVNWSEPEKEMLMEYMIQKESKNEPKKISFKPANLAA